MHLPEHYSPCYNAGTQKLKPQTIDKPNNTDFFFQRNQVLKNKRLRAVR